MSAPILNVDLSDPTKVVNSPLSVLMTPGSGAQLQSSSSLASSSSSSGASGLPSNEKLFTLLCNYLSLSQFELVRPVITELFFTSPERITHLLRSMVSRRIPDQWLFSKTLPSIGHLQWLALIEYGQLYANLFDKPVSLTPTVPLVVSSKDQRFAELANAALPSEVDNNLGDANKRADGSFKHVINPLGFVTHDQLIVQIMEIDLRKAAGSGVFVKVHQEGDEDGVFDTPIQTLSTSGLAEYNPPAKIKLNVNIADAYVVFTVVTSTARTNTSGSTSSSSSSSSAYGGQGQGFSDRSGAGTVTVGKALVGLHQLRTKDKYHIWVPLIPVHVADATQADQHLGRIRIRLRWRQVNLIPRADGSVRLFDDRTISLMETDILLAHAAVTLTPTKDPQAIAAAQLAASNTGTAFEHPTEPLLRPEHVDEIRAYCLAAVGKKDTSQLLYNNSSSNGGGKEGKKESGDVRSKFVPTHRIQHSLTALRRLVREHPALGHSLCSHLALVRPQDPTWVYLYAELIFEMLLRHEYAQALHALHILAQDIYPGDEFIVSLLSPQEAATLTGPRAMMREIYRAFVHYIHDDKGAKQHLFRLLSHKRPVEGNPAAAEGHQELDTMSREQVLAHQRRVLARKARVYGSLMSNETVLRQFCALEDYYLFGPSLTMSPGSSSSSSGGGKVVPLPKIPGIPKDISHELPLFFMTLSQALSSADQIQLKAIQEYKQPAHKLPMHVREPLHTQREEALSAFWSDYYSYARVRRQHIFEFPLKVALDCIGQLTRISTAEAWHIDGRPCSTGSSGRLSNDEKLQVLEVFWNALEMVMLPFNLLRPLLVLIAWDRVEQNYALRRQIIQRVWRPYRQNLLNISAFQAFADVAASDAADAAHGGDSRRNLFRARQECSEPKLVMYCNRLDFYLQLIDLVLGRAPTASKLNDVDKARTEAYLLAQMNRQSCIRALHPYLVELQPRYLVHALKNQIELEMEIDLGEDSKNNEFAKSAHVESWTPAQKAIYEATGLAPDGTVLDPARLANMGRNTVSVAGPSTTSENGSSTSTSTSSSSSSTSLSASGSTAAAAAATVQPGVNVAVRQAACTDLVHDMHVLCSYYAVRCILILLQEHASGRAMDLGERLETLDTCKTYLLAMQYRTYQVATLEKIYSLLFVTEADVRAQPASDDAAAAALELEASNAEYARERRLAVEREEAERAQFAVEDALMDKQAFGSAGDRFVLKGDLLLQMLEFLTNTVKVLLRPSDDEQTLGAKPVDADTRGLGISPAEDALIMERLKLVETQVEEGLWRARTFDSFLVSDSARSARLARTFSMAHVVAPLHYMAAYLLQRDRINDARSQLPMPSLPQSLSTKSMEVKALMAAGVQTANALAQQQTNVASRFTSASNNGSDNSADEKSASSSTTTRQSQQQLNKSLQSMIGIHNDLASQRDHAARLVHNADTWAGLCAFIRERLDAAAKIEAARASDSSSRTDGTRGGASSLKAKSILKGSTSTSTTAAGGAGASTTAGGVEIVSAPLPTESPADPKKLIPAISRYIEQHCRPRVANQPPEEDEILEQKYLLGLDAAIAFASALTTEQYQALVDMAIHSAERLKVYYQTVLFSRFSEPAFASADAILSAAASTRQEAAFAVKGQQLLRDDLRARVELCDMYIYFANRRRNIKDDVASTLIPSALTGNERVPPPKQDLFALYGVNAAPVPVTAVDYFDAWRKYMVSVNNYQSPPADSDDLPQDPLELGLPPSPWHSSTATHVVRYLAEAAARDAFAAHQKRLANVPDLVGALSKLPTGTITTGLTYLDPSVSAMASNGCVDSSVVNIDARSQAVLARAMLPALVAVRFAMPAAIDSLIAGVVPAMGRPPALDEAIAIATEHSRFLPTFARWVEWRSQAYQRLATWVELLVRPQLLIAADPVALVANVKALLARENAYRDSQAYTEMFMSYMYGINAVAQQTGQSRVRQLTALRLAALDLADEVLDDPVGRDNMSVALLGDPVKGAQQLSNNVDKYVEELLKDLVPSLADTRQQPLRAQLIMRIKDPVTAGEFARQFLPRWTDTELSAAVALRCFSRLAAYVPTLEAFIQTQTAKVAAGKKGASQVQIELSRDRLEHTIRLRDALAQDYQFILIYRTLEHTAAESKKANHLFHKSLRLDKQLQGEPPAPPAPSPNEEELQIYADWVSLKRESEENLETVLDQFLRWRQFALALKLFEMRLGVSSDRSSGSIHALSSGITIHSNAATQAASLIQDGPVNEAATAAKNMVAAQETLFRTGRWWFGQDMGPGAGPGSAQGPGQTSSSSGPRGTTTSSHTNIRFPQELHAQWQSEMNAIMDETRQVPPGYDEASRASLFRCSIRLESACIAMLLSRTSSARSRLQGVQHVRHLCKKHYSELAFSIIRYVMILLEYPHSRLLVMETLHNIYYAQGQVSPNATAEEMYPALSPTDAQWLLLNHASSQMLSLLPPKVQVDICTAMDAGLGGLGDPADIIEGLLRLDQPALVMAIFPRFKSFISCDRLLALAASIFAGEQLSPEIGLYFIDLCVMYEQHIPRVGETILDAVNGLAPFPDLANRLLVQKLLKYFLNNCYEYCPPETQGRYHALVRDINAGVMARNEELARAAAIEAQAPINAANTPRGRRGSLDGSSSPGPRRGSIDGSSSPGPRRGSIDGGGNSTPVSPRRASLAAGVGSGRSSSPGPNGRRGSVDGKSGTPTRRRPSVESPPSPGPASPGAGAGAGRERRGSESNSTAPMPSALKRQGSSAGLNGVSGSAGSKRTGSAERRASSAATPTAAGSGRRDSRAGNSADAAAAAAAAFAGQSGEGSASPRMGSSGRSGSPMRRGSMPITGSSSPVPTGSSPMARRPSMSNAASPR